MKVSQAFPSNFLKADDLQGRPAIVTIETAELEEIGQGRDKEQKLILGFRGKSKKLVCNKTNANTIAKLYGDDTDGWIGQRITIMPREVEFQGEMVLAIRVSLQAPGAAAAPAPRPAAAAPAPRPAAAPRPAPAPAPAPEPEPEQPPFDDGQAPVQGGQFDDVPF
jgi:hypothetical protein